jgi:hypothetical protein
MSQSDKGDAAALAYLMVASDEESYKFSLATPRSDHAKLFMYAAAHSSILSNAAKAAKAKHGEDWKSYEKILKAVNPAEIKEEIERLIKETAGVCGDIDVPTFISIAEALDEVSEEKDELAPMDGGGFGDLAKAAIAFVTSSCSRKPAELEVVLDDATRRLVDARSREPKPPSPAKSWAWMATAMAAITCALMRRLFMAKVFESSARRSMQCLCTASCMA